MARLNRDEGQWIVLMGLIISVSIFFLAVIINQSILVGQTTAESVLDFPKSDILDLRSEVFRSHDAYYNTGMTQAELDDITSDIMDISISRKSAVVRITNTTMNLTIDYNNGVTRYHEVINL